MKNSGAGMKVIVAIQAFGAVLLVVATSAFVLAGLQSITRILYPAVGGAVGSGFAFLLTRSRHSGRFIAGLLILSCLLGLCVAVAMIVSQPESLVRLLAKYAAATALVSTFLTGLFMTALFRFLGFGSANRSRDG